MKPLYKDLICMKILGGKRSLWHVYHKDRFLINARTDINYYGIGAGNTAENAIKDYMKQRRAYLKNRA